MRTRLGLMNRSIWEQVIELGKTLVKQRKMNSLQKMIWITAPALALALVSGLWITPNTVAQVRAALVRDVDHPAQQPVRIFLALNVPSGATLGAVNGTPVPAGKRLVIQMASVFAVSQEPERITRVGLTTLTQEIYASLDPQTTEGKLITSTIFDIGYNRNINFVYEPGETPRIEVRVSGTTVSKTLTFFLHGHYVNL